ncbi:CopG family transcriptional regulator [Moraxella nasovis]|uniref:CopG family transcriptional regulator n=1 Tax=Moraxella nasovis TaxID=2904121 RepID=UPI001F60885C|nr:CopG family transcriptional regulator [Moraxella nasovis]UNU72996.1 CopG family transcriptional regulator [Moraxella nasovis]
MISPKIKNKFSNHPEIITRPVHLRLSEDIICHLEDTAGQHGFRRIQGLIRLYIRQGLDRDNNNYSLAKDTLFIEKLRKKGVSQSIIDEALADLNRPNGLDG